MAKQFKQDKGVAGLTILLSVVVLLFVIGLVVMIFSLMGGEISNSLYDATTATVTNESGSATEGLNATANFTVNGATALNFRTFVVTAVRNTTSNNGSLVPTTNYSYTQAGLIYRTGSSVLYPNINVSYTYVYDTPNTATNTINDTTFSIAGVTDWFDIFIVITAMVVLILLTVIIITAIRGSGLVSVGGSSGARNVGTA